ncbi:expressed unknown protein [Seminavis robusta]|uniref:Uncharacterized protein n=1 Tax=Seminavis robusta TaxID=568900 RepID=A0A9N8EUP5_9STRA|nr:expressed unknown protein [Seminavis robusta]|eukprot:Sro2017_g311201.1  (172) ;mRNA; f:15154-15669
MMVSLIYDSPSTWSPSTSGQNYYRPQCRQPQQYMLEHLLAHHGRPKQGCSPVQTGTLSTGTPTSTSTGSPSAAGHVQLPLETETQVPARKFQQHGHPVPNNNTVASYRATAQQLTPQACNRVSQGLTSTVIPKSDLLQRANHNRSQLDKAVSTSPWPWAPNHGPHTTGSMN